MGAQASAAPASSPEVEASALDPDLEELLQATLPPQKASTNKARMGRMGRLSSHCTGFACKLTHVSGGKRHDYRYLPHFAAHGDAFWTCIGRQMKQSADRYGG
jgi:hypothetical protein